MASGDAVQQIKEKLSIEEVVAPYVELQKAGRHFKGKSPFTSEKTPSFYVSPDRGMYYCFSTSQGGDMFTFVQTIEGVDFKGALKILAEKAGVELVREDPNKRSQRDQLYAAMEATTKFYSEQLSERGGAAAAQYLKERGVTDKTRLLWRLGFAPDAWRDTHNHLTELKFSDATQRRAGLIKGETGKEPYDVFRNRVMFPMMDASGRVVAFSGRTLSSDKDTPKYVNSPETELYKKSELLFGYDKAKHGIRKFDFSLIVEGQFDVVLCHQAGYTNTVAVSGTALTDHHVNQLQRLSNRVVLALDADRAGVAAMKRAGDVMLRRGMDVKVAPLPEGKDPADIIQADPTTFKHIIGQSRHVIEHLLAILKEQARDDRAYKLKVHEDVLPLLIDIPNAIDAEHFAAVVAEATETTKAGIQAEMQRSKEVREQQTVRTRAEGAVSSPVIKASNATAKASESSTNHAGKLSEQLLHLQAIFLVRPFTEVDVPEDEVSRYEKKLAEQLQIHGNLSLPEITPEAVTQYTERYARIMADIRSKTISEFRQYMDEAFGILSRILAEAEVARLSALSDRTPEQAQELMYWYRVRAGATPEIGTAQKD